MGIFGHNIARPRLRSGHDDLIVDYMRKRRSQEIYRRSQFDSDYKNIVLNKHSQQVTHETNVSFSTLPVNQLRKVDISNIDMQINHDIIKNDLDSLSELLGPATLNLSYIQHNQLAQKRRWEWLVRNRQRMVYCRAEHLTRWYFIKLFEDLRCSKFKEILIELNGRSEGRYIKNLKNYIKDYEAIIQQCLNTENILVVDRFAEFYTGAAYANVTTILDVLTPDRRTGVEENKIFSWQNRQLNDVQIRELKVILETQLQLNQDEVQMNMDMIVNHAQHDLSTNFHYSINPETKSKYLANILSLAKNLITNTRGNQHEVRMWMLDQMQRPFSYSLLNFSVDRAELLLKLQTRLNNIEKQCNALISLQQLSIHELSTAENFYCANDDLLALNNHLPPLFLAMRHYITTTLCKTDALAIICLFLANGFSPFTIVEISDLKLNAFAYCELMQAKPPQNVTEIFGLQSRLEGTHEHNVAKKPYDWKIFSEILRHMITATPLQEHLRLSLLSYCEKSDKQTHSYYWRAVNSDKKKMLRLNQTKDLLVSLDKSITTLDDAAILRRLHILHQDMNQRFEGSELLKIIANILHTLPEDIGLVTTDYVVTSKGSIEPVTMSANIQNNSHSFFVRSPEIAPVETQRESMSLRI